MTKIFKRLSVSLSAAILLVVGALAMMSLFSQKPANLGVVNGRLADCPSSPNCVSTQASDPEHRMESIPFAGSSAEALQGIKDVLAKMNRTKIVTVEENYLHAECRSAIFRFVDDVEFLVDPQEQLIHFRSASRVGYSDFGANRRRMEQIRKAFGVE